MLFKQYDEMDLHALLDAQLSAEDEKRVLAQLAVNHEMIEKYRALKQQKELLQLWWQADAPGFDNEDEFEQPEEDEL